MRVSILSFFVLLCFCGLAFAGQSPVPDPVTNTGDYLSRLFEAVQAGWGVPLVAIAVIGLVGAVRKWGIKKLTGNWARLAAFGVAALGAISHAAAVGEPINWQLISMAINVGVAAIAMHTVGAKARAKALKK